MERRLSPVAPAPDAWLAECRLHEGEEIGLFGLAGDLKALELAIEPDIDEQGTGILMEMEKCAIAPRERTAFALAQLRQLAQFDQQRLYLIKIFLGCMPHASSITQDLRAPQALSGGTVLILGPELDGLRGGAQDRLGVQLRPCFPDTERGPLTDEGHGPGRQRPYPVTPAPVEHPAAEAERAEDQIARY
jgi:hypothetical protein